MNKVSGKTYDGGIQKKIQGILDAVLQSNSLLSGTLEELSEQLRIFHQELYNQNDELQRANVELSAAKTHYEDLFLNAPVGYVIFDRNGLIVKANHTFCEMVGLTQKTVTQHKITDFVKPVSQDKMYFVLREFFSGSEPKPCELEILGVNGTIDVNITMARHSNGIKDACEQLVRCALSDITELKTQQQHVLHISYHDVLTGMLNQRFFNENIESFDKNENLPLSVAVVDIDALKLVNDMLGHTVGDKVIVRVAESMKKFAMPGFALFRTGGDEFVVVMPQTPKQGADEYAAKLKADVGQSRVGGVQLSVSIGCVTKQDVFERGISFMISKADDLMYDNKLQQSDHKSKIAQILLKELFARDNVLEQHSRSVSHLAHMLGKMLGLKTQHLEQLIQSGLYHDIGLQVIGIPLLLKKRDVREESEFMRHPQVGCRILRSLNGMGKVAEAVLFHHERWDGKGFPYGFSGSKIPFFSRILAVADCYDLKLSSVGQLTRLNGQEVLRHMQSLSGTVLDPRICGIFVTQYLEPLLRDAAFT